MRTKLKVDVSGAVLAATATAAMLLAGAGWTGILSAQAPAAAAKTKNAGETFKNVTTTSLKALTVDDFMGAMGVISADLGLDCADCHPGAGTDKANFVIDTPQKITARKMINMVAVINNTNFNGVQNVTCWTCHHGKEVPANTITLDKLYGSPNDEHDDFVAQQPGEPKGTEVLDKYIAALGGAQKLATLKSFIASGTSVGYEGLGGGGSFQIFAKAPDQRTTLIVFKDHPERGDTHRVYDGKVGWNKTPRNAVPEYQLSGSELDGVRVDALLSFPGNIKTALTGLRTATADIGDRDVEVVQGSGPRGMYVTLYFDKKTNLMVRMVRYSNSPVGRIPTQVDYSDYRDVGGIKFPFQYTFSWLDGKDSFKISDVKVNVPIDASVFAKP
jgi:photosynthetic reaction center cytochrome c subunit